MIIARNTSLVACVIHSIISFYYFVIGLRFGVLYDQFEVNTRHINPPLIIFFVFSILNFVLWKYLKGKEKLQIGIGYSLVTSILLLAAPFVVTYLSAQYFQPQSVNVNFEYTPRPTEKDLWEKYSNGIYQFELNYPKGFQIAEDKTLESYYDNVVEMSDKDTKIKVRSISNIDIYQNTTPETVAKREISDSDFSHKTSPIMIGDYSGALTIINGSDRELEASAQISILTISHPSKNLFVEIKCEGDCELLSQVLSSFRFTD